MAIEAGGRRQEAVCKTETSVANHLQLNQTESLPASCLLPPISRGVNYSMIKKINVGLIGVGRMGMIYAQDLVYRVPGANLAAASDIDPTVEGAVKELGVPKWYQHYQDLIADPQVDAIVIVTPTSIHCEMALEAAKAGKAIFCEKPLSISLDEASATARAIADSGVFFHMGFMRRFDSGYRVAKEKLDRGMIGKPVAFKASSRDPFRPSLEYLDPRHSGGMIIDMGIHDIDLARWLMGEIKSVYAIGGVLSYPEVSEVGDIDNAIITLTFESGALGVIDITRKGVYGYDIRTEILGTEGTLKIGYLRETPITVSNKDGVTHDVVPYFMQRFERAYADQLINFVEHLAQDKPPSIGCADGVAALEIAVAATRSFKENRPVTLPLSEKDGQVF
jgi:inositol 2-dehydrogenase